MELPLELRQMIWDLAIPTRYTMMMDKNACGNTFRIAFPYSLRLGPILQPPPAIAHVCAESRRIAQKKGSMVKVTYQTWSGYTWFQSDRDFILDADMATAIVSNTNVDRIILLEDDAFEGLPEGDGISMISTLYNVCSRIPKVETIYIAKKKFFHIADQSWDPSIVSEIFNGDSVVVAANDEYHGSNWARLNEIFGRESTKKALQGVMEPYWNSAEALRENSPEEGLWPLITREIQDEWETWHEFSIWKDRKIPNYLEERRLRAEHGPNIKVIPCSVLVKSDVYPEDNFRTEGLYWRENDPDDIRPYQPIAM